MNPYNSYGNGRRAIDDISAAPSVGADHRDVKHRPTGPCRQLVREVLPVRSCDTRIGWFLQRCLTPIIVSAVVMVVAHLWAHQVASRSVLWISTPTPVPWMCEKRGHAWQRCSWVEEISAVQSLRTDILRGGSDR